MKRLSTFLLLLVCSLGIHAQTAVIANYGDVNNSGPVYAPALYMITTGEATGAVFSRWDNTAAATLAVDTLYLYSNERRDALLKNLGKVQSRTTGSTCPMGVCYRKTFDTYDDWYHVSFPSQIDIIAKGEDPNATQLTCGRVRDVFGYPATNIIGQFYAGYYDAKLTADSAHRFGYEDSGAGGTPSIKHINYGWRDTVLTAATPLMKEGIGYMFAIEGGGTTPGHVIDFWSLNSTIAWDPALQKVPLKSYHSPHTEAEWIANGGIFFTTDQGTGWNYIGNLNTTLYGMTSSTLTTTLNDINGNNYTARNTTGQNGVIYFRTHRVGAGGFTAVNLDTSHDVVVSPYVPFYIQLDTFGFDNMFRTNYPTATSGFSGATAFTYVSTSTNAVTSNPALLLDTTYWGNALGSKHFRSSADFQKLEDYLELKLIDESAQKDPASTYIRMGDYKDYYVVSEDAVSLSAGEGANQLYSVGKYYDHIHDIPLFKNSLPMMDEHSNTQEVPLGLITPSGGKFTIELSMIDWNRMTNAILLDKYTGAQTDLLQQSYTFDAGANAEADNNRFLLFASFHGLPIITPDAVQIYGYVENSVLTVVNVAEGDVVKVLDLAGRTLVNGLSKGTEFKCNLGAKGVYVVTVKGKNSASLKVINK